MREIAFEAVPVSGATDASNGLFARLWRQRVLFALVFGIVILASAITLVMLPFRYLAAGSVIVAEPEPNVSDTSAAWAQKMGDPADLESQLLLIRSPRVVRLAATEPGIQAAVQEECTFKSEQTSPLKLFGAAASSCDELKPGSEALLDYLLAHYNVGSAGRSRVINIGYESPLPQTAQIMANALINVFLEDQRSRMSKSREAAASWLWTELRRIDDELREEETRIQAYRRSKGLARGQIAPISAERLTSMSQQLAAAEAAQAQAAARLQEITSGQKNGSSDASAVLASRSVADLKQQLNTVTAQIASASNTYGPKYPALHALQDERDNVKARLEQEVASIAAAAKKTYQASTALVSSLKHQMDEVKAEVGSATEDEASIASMVRDVDTKRNEYTDLYKRASELETQRRVLIGSTQLVSLAELPTKPFFPKKVPFLAAGFTLALLLAFAAAYFRDRATRNIVAPRNVTIAPTGRHG